MSPPNSDPTIVRSILDAQPTVSLGDLDISLMQTLIDLRNAVAEHAWPEVHRLGTQSIALGRSALDEVARRSAAVLAARDTTADVSTSLEQGVREALASEHASELMDAIRAELPADPALADRILSAVTSLDTASDAPLFDRLVAPERVGRIPAMVAPVRDAAVAAMTRGLLATIHAAFNLAVDRLAGSAAQLADLGVDDAVRGLGDTLSSGLREHQTAIHQGADSSSPTALLAFVEREMPTVAAHQAAAFVVTAALRDRGQNTRAETLGLRAARLGATMREAVASYAAAAAMTVPVADDPQLGDLQFDVPVPNGRDVELAHLEDLDDGAFIEIRGFIDGLETERSSDGKLVSRVTLLDPSSGARFRAAAVFTDLAHAGLVRGAYCLAHGTFRKASNLCNGEACLEIDRLPLARLASTGWRLAFLRLADRWFHPWRNAHHLAWSLGPHAIVDDGTVVDEAASQFGAGESLFTPFIRS